MKRDRSAVVPDGPGGARNNSRAQGGYDAYFGTYTVDDAASTVTRRLLGALSQENVDSILTREMEVRGDTLVIRVQTSGRRRYCRHPNSYVESGGVGPPQNSRATSHSTGRMFGTDAAVEFWHVKQGAGRRGIVEVTRGEAS